MSGPQHDKPSMQELISWLGAFKAKPGPSRPICSTCGEDWPCGYWQDDRVLVAGEDDGTDEGDTHRQS